jgi:hypothetical protein
VLAGGPGRARALRLAGWNLNASGSGVPRPGPRPLVGRCEVVEGVDKWAAGPGPAGGVVWCGEGSRRRRPDGAVFACSSGRDTYRGCAPVRQGHVSHSPYQTLTSAFPHPIFISKVSEAPSPF